MTSGNGRWVMVLCAAMAAASGAVAWVMIADGPVRVDGARGREAH